MKPQDYGPWTKIRIKFPKIEWEHGWIDRRQSMHTDYSFYLHGKPIPRAEAVLSEMYEHLQEKKL